MAIFDNQAQEYDNWYETRIGNFVDKVETDLAFSLLNIKPGMEILDIGCGSGNFSIKLAQLNCHVTGIDISKKMLSIAKEKSEAQGLNIDFLEMDVCDLSFENNKFDIVISMAAFEFIKDAKKAIDEMFRVTKKNGQVLIGTINKESKWGELYLSDELQQNSVFKHACFKSMEDLKSLEPNKLIKEAKCLFVPPTASESEFCIKKEEEYSNIENGGFVCALWRNI